MPRYEKAPALVGQIVERMMDRYHPQLRDAKVTVAQLMAFPITDENGDSKGPALKYQGYQATAVIKIIGLKERTDGRCDAELVIDGDNWDVLTDAQRDAIVDHELEHLELKYDKDGCLVRDDLDRPKLVIRKHDHQFGWFDAVVRRHGRDALEFKQLDEFQTVHYQQRWLPYLDDPDKTPVEADPIREATPVSDGPKPDENLNVSITAGGETVHTTTRGLQKAAKAMKSMGKKSQKPKAFGGARGGKRRMAAAGR